MPKVIKPSNPFTNKSLASVLTILFCAATITINDALLPNSRNEEMMVMVSGATGYAGLF